MIINHNMNAMNAHRLMSGNTANAGKSMEKLSSGLRINKAGDDAAGLAISEKMRGQIRGLDQASRNASDGISMIQTAEGALNETHSILQRMRELATQASNDTNVSVDRNEIQKEMNQLTSEINRIGNTTEFNTQKILLGSDSGLVLKDALNLNKTGVITDPVKLAGGVTTAPQAANLAVTALAVGGDATGVDGDKITFNLNGKTITATFSATSTYASASIGDASAITNITANSFTIGVASSLTATAVAARIAEGLKAAIALDSDLTAKGYTVNAATAIISVTSTQDTGASKFISMQYTDTSSNSGIPLQEGTAQTTVFGKDINYTAATATINFSSINTATAATDLIGKGITIGDKTIEFYDASKGVYTGKADYAVDVQTAIAATTNAATALVNAIQTQLKDKVDGFTLTNNGTNTTVLKIASTANGEAGNNLVVSDGVSEAAVRSKAFNATFQVGANEGQGFTIEINDMRGKALNISGTAGNNATEGAKFTSANVVTNGTDNTVAEAALDVSNYQNATSAIKVINNAIESVSAERSKLGAYQNRLEHTINNLGTSSENLTAAESRIRDVDMAKEMMNFSKNNILSQAAQAMLAQANQQPQGVLQLLR